MSARARIAALFCALVALLGGFATSAQAAPYTPAAAVSVDRSNPCHGTSLVVRGTGYAPGSTVTIVIGGTRVGRVDVGAGGTFTVSVTVPDALRGRTTVTATGSSGGRVATTAITVGDCGLGTAPENGNRSPGAGGAGTLGENGNRGGGLSSTGVAVLSLLVVAVVLVGAGGALLLGGRRRRSGTA